MPSIAEYAGTVDDLSAKLRLVKEKIDDEERAKALAESVAENARIAQEIVQGIAQHIQQQVHNSIADVVTRCLAAVFDDPYEFKIVFEQKRGKTEARLVFLRNELEVDPLTAAGGGVVDVAAFALRIAALVLSRPQLRRLIIADEPFRFVSAGYRARVKGLLQTLADDMGIQFVIVTHFEEFRIGKVIDLGEV